MEKYKIEKMTQKLNLYKLERKGRTRKKIERVKSGKTGIWHSRRRFRNVEQTEIQLQAKAIEEKGSGENECTHSS